jgi:Ca-activated chloride channel family protein
VLALARPQTVRERRVAEMRRMDIVVLLDMSPSMRARDIAPSRLYQATEVIDQFIQKKLPEDRFGLVSFADTSLVLSYLTADPSNMMFYLDYLRKETALQYGTNIGGALRSGIQVMSRQQEIEPRAAKNKQVFVLLSDGEDQGEELEDQIAQTIKRAIPVYCIGIGSREGAYIPIGEKDGKTEYLTGKEGQRILTTFNEEALRRITEKTGGRYYRAHTGMEMSQAFADIFLKTREVETYHRVREPKEHYQVLLAAAFGLFLLRVLI